MYSRTTLSRSITAFSLCCRYLAMDVAVAASWSLLSNQDCISNILASFTGSPSAILMYRLYPSIDLLLHSTFTRQRWFLNGRGEEQRWFWIRTGEEQRWFWTGIGEEGGGFEMEEERSGTGFRLEHERSGGGLRGEERNSNAGLGSIFFCVF